jgi:phytoene synthase
VTTQRDRLVRFAGSSIQRGSKSFRAASRLFDRTTRERAWLLYAWCRACDDMIDGQDMGGARVAVTDAPERLARVEALTRTALEGAMPGEPAFDCLALVVRECALPPELVRDVVRGFALDVEGWMPASEHDLMTYCYHVAGAVGCLMAVIMGVSPDNGAVLDRACDLGLAFQLANIARDVREDASAGVCYLPRDWLDAEGLTLADLLDDRARPAVIRLTTRLAVLSARYAASARCGTPALGNRDAWAVLAAAGIYGGIARKVERDGAAALDRRMVVGRGEKLGLLAKAAGQSLLRARLYPMTARDADLWQRPRGLL